MALNGFIMRYVFLGKIGIRRSFGNLNFLIFDASQRTMDYEKKYPITQQPGDVVIARWERGYKYLELYYKDRLVTSVEGIGKLRKGFRITDPELNVIELKLSESPMMLDVIIDGYHSPANVSHPSKELKKTATYFWIITVFAFLMSIGEGMLFGLNPIGGIVIGIDLLVVAAYVVALIYVRKGKPWAYFMGVSVFTVMFLLSLFSLLIPNLVGIIGFVLRVLFLVLLLTNMKYAVAAQKHLRYGTQEGNVDLLDSQM